MNTNKEILMEAGTNELEILLFGIGQECYGINVAKVREIIKPPKITTPPQFSTIIEGVFNLRDQIIPIINLRKALGYPTKENEASDRVIISEYHQQWFGFIADSVDTINRISWSDIESPPEIHQQKNILTGIAHLENKLVLMLDVEKITEPLLQSFLQNKMGSDESVSESRSKIRANKRILAVDDSGVIRTLVKEKLVEAGFEQILLQFNGKDAWELLQQDHAFDLIITDIEMPQMDGLHLTKLIKSNDQYKHIPIIIFSSIISQDNKNKGKRVGAEEQISKPEINRLIGTVDRLLNIE